MNNKNGEKEHLLMFILDVLRHDDAEDPRSITNMLNDYETVGWRDHWPRDFTEEEVRAGILTLLERGMVALLKYDETTGTLTDETEAPTALIVGSSWIRMTARGSNAIQHWKPPADEWWLSSGGDDPV